MKQVLLDGDLIFLGLEASERFEKDFDSLWDALQSRQIKGYITKTDLDKLSRLLREKIDDKSAATIISEVKYVLEVWDSNGNETEAFDVIVSENYQDFTNKVTPVLSLKDFLERQYLNQLLELTIEQSIKAISPQKLYSNHQRKVNEVLIGALFLFPILVQFWRQNARSGELKQDSAEDIIDKKNYLQLNQNNIFDQQNYEVNTPSKVISDDSILNKSLLEKSTNVLVDPVRKSEYITPGNSFANKNSDRDDIQSENQGQSPIALNGALLLLDIPSSLEVKASFLRSQLQLVNSSPSTISSENNLQKNITENIIKGTIGNDILIGSPNNDFINGKRGNDLLIGGAGNDKIFGGEGQDTLVGGEGQDTLVGGDGTDTLVGGEGQDTLVGGEGQDTLVGGEGQDLLLGGTGNDSLFDANQIPTKQQSSSPLKLNFTNSVPNDIVVPSMDITNDNININPLNDRNIHIIRNIEGDRVGVSDSITGNITSNTGEAAGNNNKKSTISSGSDRPENKITLGEKNLILNSAGSNIPIGSQERDSLLGGSGGNKEENPKVTNFGNEVSSGSDDNEPVQTIENEENLQITNFGNEVSSGNDDNEPVQTFDTLIGGIGDDTLKSTQGNDFLISGSDNDEIIIELTKEQKINIVDGGEGSDLLRFRNASFNDFDITTNNLGQFIFTNLNSPEFMTTAINMEFVAFDDRTVDLSTLVI